VRPELGQPRPRSRGLSFSRSRRGDTRGVLSYSADPPAVGRAASDVKSGGGVERADRVTSVATHHAISAEGFGRIRPESPSLLARFIWTAEGGLRPLGASLAGLMFVAYAFMFFRWFDRQFGPRGDILGVDFGRGSYSFNSFEDWGHAYIIPFIAGAYIWTRRHTFRPELASTFWPGLGPLLVGIAIYAWFATVRPSHMFQGLAMIVALSGLVILLLGPHLFRRLLFPIAYLSLGVTISEQIMLAITWPLKQIAAQGGHMMLTVLGVENTLTGTVLNVFDSAGTMYPLDVADACSGMRMVVAFVALSVAVAFFSCRQWWQRAAVVLVSVPVALFMNIIRVAVLAYLTLFDPNLAVGGAHSLIGTLLLVPAFFMFMGFVWIFRHLTPDEPAPGGGKGAGA